MKLLCLIFDAASKERERLFLRRNFALQPVECCIEEISYALASEKSSFGGRKAWVGTRVFFLSLVVERFFLTVMDAHSFFLSLARAPTTKTTRSTHL